MKAIFPQSIDDDLPNLVHLSNGFHMLDDASPLHVGDVVTAEAKIASVIDTDAGKAVKVIGNVIHEGKPIVEVISSFLYRGRFTDFRDRPRVRLCGGITVIIIQKLKKPANEVPLSKSTKDLVGGKSTLQNKILGDLGQEFSSAPEKGEELPLEELGAALVSASPEALASTRQDLYPTSLVEKCLEVSTLVSSNHTSRRVGVSVLNVQMAFSSSVLLWNLQNAWVPRLRRRRGWTKLLRSIPSVRVSRCRLPRQVVPVAMGVEGL